MGRSPKEKDRDAIDLETSTTEQLIGELFSRTTFAGVLVYSPAAHKFPHQNHDKFLVMSTVENGGTIRLLENTADAFRNTTGEP